MFGVPKITAPTGLYPSNPSSLPTPGFTPLMTPPGAARTLLGMEWGAVAALTASPGRSPGVRQDTSASSTSAAGGTPVSENRHTEAELADLFDTFIDKEEMVDEAGGGKKDESGPAFLSLPDVWTTQHVEKAEDKVRGGAACVVCVCGVWCARCEDWRLRSVRGRGGRGGRGARGWAQAGPGWIVEGCVCVCVFSAQGAMWWRPWTEAAQGHFAPCCGEPGGGFC